MNTGRTHYEKGHIPWSKGQKGVCLNTGRTHFKKGYTPWNKGKKYDKIRGKNHWNWKGGTSKPYQRAYFRFAYQDWRRKVFKRDDYICQKCGKRGDESGGYLTAHHIKSFTHYPKLRYKVSNGITLCEKCHSLTDNYKGKANSKKGNQQPSRQRRKVQRLAENSDVLNYRNKHPLL